MTRKLRSSTGRGLSTAYAGEIVAVVVCVLYLLTQSVRLLVLGFVLAGFVGFVSVVRMWRGQDEFGPTHRHNARRGTYLYFVASLFFVLAFLSFGTFTSPTTGIDLPGDNETASPTTPHRFRDLIPPLVLLGIALATETFSGAYYLWELAGVSLRRIVIAHGALGLGLALIVFTHGFRLVGDLRSTYGENVGSADLAEFYYEGFLRDLLPVFAVGFALTRAVAIFLVRRASAKVAEAEAEQVPTEAVPAL